MRFAVGKQSFFNSPDCSGILFLRGKKRGEKDIAESRFPASNNFKIKNFHLAYSLLPAFSLFLQFRRKKNYGKARRCFQESDFSR